MNFLVNKTQNENYSIVYDSVGVFSEIIDIDNDFNILYDRDTMVLLYHTQYQRR